MVGVGRSWQFHRMRLITISVLEWRQDKPDKASGEDLSDTEELEPSKNQRLRRFYVKCEMLAGELCPAFNPVYGRAFVWVASGAARAQAVC